MQSKTKPAPKPKPQAVSKPEAVVRDIKRVTCNKYSGEDKIRIILEGLRGETAITEICRREGLGCPSSRLHPCLKCSRESPNVAGIFSQPSQK